MFDVSFSELLVVGAVALVVIGPERLPRVSRAAGLLVGRARRYVQTMKAEIDRDLELDEWKNLQREVAASVQNMETELRRETDEAAQSLRALEAEAQSAPAAIPPREMDSAGNVPSVRS
ncbi:MAG: Sec-independent protein translocase protein TatB [Zoogloeaceae bacterium]|jgi:sec-independent protein translocase protein TatB|nr:Sec-independent protein translocase protein TatB [Zoogloeaceae bacterium]